MPGRHCLFLAVSSLLLAGCSALPASGPTERQVLEAEQAQANELGFKIVDVNRQTVSILTGARLPVMAQLAETGAAGRVDTIGPGDVLSVSIFEVGSGLFTGGNTAGSVQPGAEATSGTTAGTGRLADVQVDSRGFVNVPYVGRVRAGGRTTTELAEAIRGGLKRLSQDPQVTVSLTTNLSNTVIVSGDVKSPGRKPVTVNRERLSDMVAISGGLQHAEQDTYIQLTRMGRTARIPLLDLQRIPSENVILRPGDRVQLVFQPRSFTVFGAAGKVAEVAMEAANVTLAEGVARSGGPANDRADPNAVFLFRYEPRAVAQQLGAVPDPTLPPTAPQPVIYRLDMMNPTSYFLAQRFDMRDKDLIYIANARTDRFSKFVGILYQLAYPIVTGIQLSR